MSREMLEEIRFRTVYDAQSFQDERYFTFMLMNLILSKFIHILLTIAG